MGKGERKDAGGALRDWLRSHVRFRRGGPGKVAKGAHMNVLCTVGREEVCSSSVNVRCWPKTCGGAGWGILPGISFVVSAETHPAPVLLTFRLLGVAHGNAMAQLHANTNWTLREDIDNYVFSLA